MGACGSDLSSPLLPLTNRSKVSKMQVVAKRCAGLDVHKMSIVVTILLEQEDGTVESKTRTFSTFKRDRRALASWLMEHHVELCVMESTGIFWKSPMSTLKEAGLNVWLVNARHVKNMPGRKTDVSDSQWLADLARFGLVKPSFVPEQKVQALRLLSRRRQSLVKSLRVEKQRLHKCLDDAGIRLGGVVSDIDGVSAREIVQGLIEGVPIPNLARMAKGRLRKKMKEIADSLDETLSEEHLFLLRQITSLMGNFKEQIQTIDRELDKRVQSDFSEYWHLLQTIPGIDKVAATGVIAEIGVNIGAFQNGKHLASWAGFCPGNNESAGKRYSGRTRKGNQWLRTLLCEVAHAASRTRCQFKTYYQNMVIRRGKKRSIIAVAHKILRVIYSMFKSMTEYRDSTVDYEALLVHRNAPRWLKYLKQYSYIT